MDHWKVVCLFIHRTDVQSVVWTRNLMGKDGKFLSSERNRRHKHQIDSGRESC